MKKEGTYKHGFKTPESYFETFDERFFDALENSNGDNTLGETPMNLPSETGYKTPEGYFETLETKIFEKIAVVKVPSKVIPIYRRKAFLYSASIAASIVFLFGIYTKNSNSLENLEVADIEAYFNNDKLEFDSFDVAQVLSETDIENLAFDDPMFTEENLENYLLEHLDDTTLLIE